MKEEYIQCLKSQKKKSSHLLIQDSIETNCEQDAEKPQYHIVKATQVKNTHEQPLTHLQYIGGWLPSITPAHRQGLYRMSVTRPHAVHHAGPRPTNDVHTIRSGMHGIGL